MRKAVTNSGLLDGVTDYYYSGWRVCEEYTVTSGTEALKYQYVWGAVYYDEIIVRDNIENIGTILQLNDGLGSDRQFHHHNSLFSVFAVSDETGAVLERYQYDPYGNQSIFDASFNVLTRFSGWAGVQLYRSTFRCRNRPLLLQKQVLQL